MPRDSSGVYTKPSGTTAINGATISSTSFNTLIDDIVSDLNAGSPLARVPYANRAAAIAAEVEAGLSEIAVMTPDGFVLLYTRDATGDALTTNSGAETWSPAGEVTPLHWAENTTPGTTELASGVQSAVDWVGGLGGGTVKFLGSASYKISTMIDVTDDNIHIDVGDATIDASSLPDVVELNRPDGVFNILGTASATTTLSADASPNDSTFSVTSASGIAAGDAIFLQSDSEHWYQEGAVSVAQTSVNRVMGVSGTTLELQHANNRTFTIATDTINVTTWAGVQNFRLTGGHYIGPGDEGVHDNGEGPAVVYSLLTQNIEVHDIRSTVGFQGAWIWTQKNYGGEITGNRGSGHADDYSDTLVESENMGFTGIIVTESMGLTVSNNTGYRFRHLVDGARSRDVIVSNNHAYDCHRAPFGSHLGCTDWTFSKNVARSRFGGGGGILWRGFDVTVSNNRMIGLVPSGSYGFYDTVGTAADEGKTYLISGNEFESARNALGLYSNIKTALVADNILRGGNESTSYSPIDIGTMDLDYLYINGGSATCDVGGSCISINGNSPRSRRYIKIKDVKMDGFTTYAVASPASSTATTTLIVEGNDMTARSGPTGYVQAAGSSYAMRSFKTNHSGGAVLNIDDDFGGSAFSLVLSDGSNDLTPQTTRAVNWAYRDGMFTGAFAIRITSKGSLSGALRITGWPKSPSGTGGGQVAFADGLNVTAGQTITLQPISGENRVDLYLNDSTTGTTTLGDGEITDTFRIEGMVTYPA